MFEIISYGGGNLDFQVLNAVAMFFGSGNYLFTMKLVATMAALAILMQAAFTSRMPDLKWLLVIIFVYMFAFVPKVTVTITDTVERTPGFPTSTPTVRVVGNVPMGLAFVAAFTSHMKDYFVQGIETVFALPQAINYRQAGPLFAQGIAEKSLEVAPQNPNTVSSLANFWRDCVFFDMALGFYSMNDLVKADNLQGFLAANVNGNRFYQQIADDGSQSFQSCNTSISGGGALDVQLSEERQKSAAWVSMVNNFATKPSASTNATMLASGAAAMPVAMSYLTGMSVTSSNMLSQAILANSFQNGLVSFSSQAGAQEVMQGYAAAKAEAERSLSFSTLGKISGRMMPLINIIAEALIYAVFPIVALFMLWPGGYKAAGAYAMALIWIALWAPMYAIVHFISTFYASIAVGSAAQICDAASNCTPHLNLYTMHSLKDAFANAAAISGFMATMVPYIAYMVVSRSGAMMAGTVGRLLDGYSQPVSHAAMEASAGNVSMGTMNYENQTAFQYNSAPAQSAGALTTNNGRNVHVDTNQVGIDQMNLDRGAASMNASSNVQAQLSQTHTDATKATETAQASLTEANANRFNTLVSAENAVSHGIGVGTRHGMDHRAGHSDTLNNVEQSAKAYAEKNGVSQEYMNSAMAEAGLRLPGVAGVSADARNTEAYKHAQEVAKNYVNSQEFRSSIDRSESAYLEKTASTTDDVTRSGRQSVSDAHEKSVTAQKSYTAAKTHEESVAKAQQDLTAHGVGTNVDATRWIKEKLEDSEEGWEHFNERLNRGDVDAMQKLEQYKNVFAASRVAVAVKSSEVDIAQKADDAIAKLENTGGAAVQGATDSGTAGVNQKRAHDGTTAADGDAIKGHAAARSAESDAQQAETRSAVDSHGAKVKGAVDSKTSGVDKPAIEQAVAAAGSETVVTRAARQASLELGTEADAAGNATSNFIHDKTGMTVPGEQNTPGSKGLFMEDKKDYLKEANQSAHDANKR